MIPKEDVGMFGHVNVSLSHKKLCFHKEGTYVYNWTFCQYKLSLFFFIKNSVYTPANAERQADNIPNMYPWIGDEKTESHEASPQPLT